MNTYQLTNPIEQLELEELESWDPLDFDDFLPKIHLSESENAFIQDNSLGWH